MFSSKMLVKERLLFVIAVAMIKKNFKNPSVIPTVKMTVVHLCNMVKLAM